VSRYLPPLGNVEGLRSRLGARRPSQYGRQGAALSPSSDRREYLAPGCSSPGIVAFRYLAVTTTAATLLRTGCTDAGTNTRCPHRPPATVPSFGVERTVVVAEGHRCTVPRRQEALLAVVSGAATAGGVGYWLGPGETGAIDAFAMPATSDLRPACDSRRRSSAFALHCLTVRGVRDGHRGRQPLSISAMPNIPRLDSRDHRDRDIRGDRHVRRTEGAYLDRQFDQASSALRRRDIPSLSASQTSPALRSSPPQSATRTVGVIILHEERGRSRRSERAPSIAPARVHASAVSSLTALAIHVPTARDTSAVSASGSLFNFGDAIFEGSLRSGSAPPPPETCVVAISGRHAPRSTTCLPASADGGAHEQRRRVDDPARTVRIRHLELPVRASPAPRWPPRRYRLRHRSR